MYSLPSTSQTWLPSARCRNSGATPRTNCVWPLLKDWVADGITFSARAKYSSERALGGQARLAPRAGQRRGREHFRVLAVGECRRLRVARVVEAAARVEKPRQHEAGHSRIEQRAVGRDADDDGDAEAARRLVEA